MLRTILYYWKSSLQYLLCPRILRTTLVLVSESLHLNNLHLSNHACKFVLDLPCVFPDNTHVQQLIPAQILYQCPFRNILDFVYGGSQFSTGVIFLHVCVRHEENGPLWYFFYTWDTFSFGQRIMSLRRQMTPRSFFDGCHYCHSFLSLLVWSCCTP